MGIVVYPRLTADALKENAMVTHSSVSTRYTKYKNDPELTNSINDADSVWTIPALVKGTWITYGNGQKFRRTTNYGRSRVVIERGNPYFIQGFRKSDKTYFHRRSDAGGFRISQFTSGGWAYRLNSPFGIPNINQPPSIPTEERNEAITKSLNDLADQKVNLGENLLTLRQTGMMFIRPVRNLINGINDLRKNPVYHPFLTKSSRNLIREGLDRGIVNRYLEYVYGLAPLLSDIHSIAELAKRAGAGPLLLKSKGTAYRNIGTGDLYTNNISDNQDEYWTGIRLKAKTKATLWAKLSDQYALSRTLNQLGLLNPASLVWELVPFSFLIDWVLPIGPVLQAYTAPAGLDFVDGSISRRCTATAGYLIECKFDSGYQITSSTPATGNMRYEGYTRERISSWPTPGLWIDRDPLRLSSDQSDRVLKALALAIARLPRY